MTGLDVIMGGDSASAAANAARIAPVRASGNRLLCTLLLGNVAVNSVLAILMADIAGGLAGGLVSTAVIVVFGEIIPQATCSRYALQIGARSIPVVKVLMFLFFPIAYPLALVLDAVLGSELGNIHSKAEMKRLLEIHVERGGFGEEIGKAMTGALQYQDLQVRVGSGEGKGRRRGGEMMTHKNTQPTYYNASGRIGNLRYA
jgi:metal transporter CNNM